MIDPRSKVSAILDALESDRSAYEQASKDEASKERDYRKFKGEKMLESKDGTVLEKQAWLDSICADKRYERDLARNMKEFHREALRSRQAEIYLLKTLIEQDAP